MSEPQALEYQINLEIYGPYAGAAEMESSQWENWNRLSFHKVAVLTDPICFLCLSYFFNYLFKSILSSKQIPNPCFIQWCFGLFVSIASLAFYLQNNYLAIALQRFYFCVLMLNNTEGAIKNGQSRDTGNIRYTKRRQTKQQQHNTICVGHHYA